MERRSLLRQLLSPGSRNLVKLASGNCLATSDQREVKAISRVLSSFYGRNLGVTNLRRGAASVVSYALSPLGYESNHPIGTSTQSSIQQYEIAKIGRREFLIIGGAVMALAVGSTLHFASPAFRTLTKTVTNTVTLTQPGSTLIRTTEICRTSETTSNTYSMTVSTVWYNRPAHMGQGYEIHFKTARRGRIADVRHELESQGTTYFQKAFYDQFGRHVPEKRLRIGFEREEPAARTSEQHHGANHVHKIPRRKMEFYPNVAKVFELCRQEIGSEVWLGQAH